MRFAGGNVVCRVEGGEVFSDDFFRGVTFDFLRACVPADHVAVGIQQVNGVLLDAIYQNVELFGGVVQCGVIGPILRHRMRQKFSNTIRTFSLIRFPRHQDNFLEKVSYTQGQLAVTRRVRTQSL